MFSYYKNGIICFSLVLLIFSIFFRRINLMNINSYNILKILQQD